MWLKKDVNIYYALHFETFTDIHLLFTHDKQRPVSLTVNLKSVVVAFEFLLDCRLFVFVKNKSVMVE